MLDCPHMPLSLRDRLVQLDFSPADAAVYEALIECSPASAGPLIEATGLHRNIVYTSLEHLIARKLAAKSTVRGRAQFRAVAPTVLAEEFKEKAAVAAAVAAGLAARIKRGAQEITVHQGNEEYLQLLTELVSALPKNGTQYVLGTGGAEFMHETMLPIWEKYHAVAHARGITIRMIGYEPQRAALAPHIAREKIYRMRYLPATAENPSGIHIYPEAQTVLNVIYSDTATPVTAIRIRDKRLAAGYLHLFENLWRAGKA